MNHKFTRFMFFGMALAMLLAVSCSDDSTEKDLIDRQNDAKLDELKSLSAKDSLKFLLDMEALEYRKYLDSLARVDSIARAEQLNAPFLPYTYEVHVINGSTSTVGSDIASPHRKKAFEGEVKVTITQYGVKQTQTSSDGLFTFTNMGVGAIHGKIEAPGYTGFEWTVDASLPYNFLEDLLDAIDGNEAPHITANIDVLIKYFNQRGFGNTFPIFATQGNAASVVTGRAFIETDLTNATKEVVPAGTKITARIDANNEDFKEKYIIRYFDEVGNTYGNSGPLNSIFSPKNWAIEYLGSATTNEDGDYTLNVPASPDGSVPVVFEYSDIVANKTFYLQSNGDVTENTRRNVYGPNKDVSTFPSITLAPEVYFYAGGGATATATISGSGSITDIDLISGGSGYVGIPRVWIQPPANGVQATATAEVTNGVVTGITLVSGGSGYTSVPSITITEGTGGDATVDTWVTNAQNGGVASVVVTNSGGGYTSAPTVVFFIDGNNNGTFDYGFDTPLTEEYFPNGYEYTDGGSGVELTITDFPTATAVLNAGAGTISRINVTNSGSGFTPDAGRIDAFVTSGYGAAGTVTITDGTVEDFDLVDNGRSYSAAPRISINYGFTLSDTDVPAQLTAVMVDGHVNDINIVDGGNYDPAMDGTYALIFDVDGDVLGSFANQEVVYEGVGIGGASITAVGSPGPDGKYYTTIPRVVFPEPNYKGPGSRQATGTAVLGPDGRLAGITITDAGSGYTSLPDVQIISGSGAAAISKFANVGVDEIEVYSGGEGYIVAPQVLIVDPTKAGSGATAVAKITNGRVSSIEVTNAGNGYINGASVIILDPGTSYDQNSYGTYPNVARANVVVEDGAVTSINVYQEGANYPAGTEVRVTSNKGSGLAATATVVNGAIVDVVVTNEGTGYVGRNFARPLNGIVSNSFPWYNTAYEFYLSVDDNDGSEGIFNESHPFYGKAGSTKVIDIDYGTGLNRD